MKVFTTIVAASAMTVASVTASLAGSPVAGTDDPFIEPVVPVGSSASLGGGALPVIAGVAAAALLAAAISSDSDSTSTHAEPTDAE